MMTNRVSSVGAVLPVAVVGFLSLSARVAASEVASLFFDVVVNGRSAATVVVPDDDAPMWGQAVALISETCERWGGVKPDVHRMPREGHLPLGNVIVIGTPDTLPELCETSHHPDSKLLRVPTTCRHGYAIESRATKDCKQLVIAGKTPRGAFNGAVYCRDFLLDSTIAPTGGADVFVRKASLLRSPHFQIRGSYTLTMYGIAPQYTAEDWQPIIDRFAEDGMERTYFWLSGHYPSKKYPELYNVDEVRGTRLTVEGVRNLIRYCHDRDISFYIGGGAFGWIATGRALAKAHPETASEGVRGTCPASPRAREIITEHYLEICDSLPEADGFFFELRDELGECQCARCQTVIDEDGSKAYGQYEISWLQAFCRAAWKRNPKLRICSLVGYNEHQSDVNYYRHVRQMNDPRIEWLDCRVGLLGDQPWVMPGPRKEMRPMVYFSHRISHWSPQYWHPIEWTMLFARRAADEGYGGFVTAFEPGFHTASYYHDVIPFPVNILPYALSGFIYRELTWDPALTREELNMRVQRRFFSPDSPARLAEDLIYLRSFMTEHKWVIPNYSSGYVDWDCNAIPQRTIAGELARILAITDAVERTTQERKALEDWKKLAAVPDHLSGRMAEIETLIEDMSPNATPKTREGFALMQRLIDDTRKYYGIAVPDREALIDAINRLAPSP